MGCVRGEAAGSGFGPCAGTLIWYVDDIASLMKAQERLEMEGELSIVGLDLEWRDPRPAALLQLGFQFHRVLLIDVLPCLNDLEAATARTTTTTTLAQSTSYTHQLTQFLNNLLTNSIVVGYGFLNDIQRLGRALPLLRPSSFEMNVVDLSLVNTKTSSLLEMLCPAAYQEYQAGPPPKKGRGGGGGAGGRRRQNKSKGKGKGKGKGKKHVAWCTMGLSGLVEKSFGKPLSKAEQCSNWERRPLTKSQRKYAAMDAMILVELYEVGAERRREKAREKAVVVEEKEEVVGREENMLDLKKKVRELFDENVKNGMAANEAAAKALVDVRAKGLSNVTHINI